MPSIARRFAAEARLAKLQYPGAILATIPIHISRLGRAGLNAADACWAIRDRPNPNIGVTGLAGQGIGQWDAAPPGSRTVEYRALARLARHRHVATHHAREQ